MAVKEISATSHRMLQEELVSLKQSKPELQDSLEKALEFGDVSENSEYEIAKANLEQTDTRIAEIQSILSKAKIKTVYSNTISSGTLITVKIVDNGIEDDLGLLMFDEVGDLVLQGKVTPSSPLGKAIVGTNGGEFDVQDISGNVVKYIVTIEPEGRLLEYLEMYPTDKKKLFSSIFAGV